MAKRKAKETEPVTDKLPDREPMPPKLEGEGPLEPAKAEEPKPFDLASASVTCRVIHNQIKAKPVPGQPWLNDPKRHAKRINSFANDGGDKAEVEFLRSLLK